MVDFRNPENKMTKRMTDLLELRGKNNNINEPRHVISNSVALWQVQTQMSLCSLLLS